MVIGYLEETFSWLLSPSQEILHGQAPRLGLLLICQLLTSHKRCPSQICRGTPADGVITFADAAGCQDGGKET